MNPEKIPVEKYNLFTIKVGFVESEESYTVDRSYMTADGDDEKLKKFIESRISAIVAIALKQKFKGVSPESIIELLKTYDIYLPGDTVERHKVPGETTVKYLRDHTDPTTTEIELTLRKKLLKLDLWVEVKDVSSTTDMELFYRDDKGLESAEDYFKQMIQNKDANATFVSVKVPAHRIPGEITRHAFQIYCKG